MIVVKAELHSAITGRVTELGRMVIANDGASIDPKRGHYNAGICRAGSNMPSANARRGAVRDYPRQSYVIWRLILRALRSCYPEER